MKKRKLISTLCMVLIIMQFQSVIAFATEENSGNSESDTMTDEEFYDLLDQLVEQSKEEAEAETKQNEEEAKKQEAATANISPLLVDPVIKNKFIFQKRNYDNILVYTFNGSEKDLENAGARIQHFNYSSNHLFASVKGGWVENNTAYFVDGNIKKSIPIFGGAVSTSKDVIYSINNNGKLCVTNLLHTRSSKYKGLVNEIFHKIDGDILYPSILADKVGWTLSDNYDLLMESKYRKFLADLAVKYKICDDSETTTMKARLALSVFYDLYNGIDNLVNYDTDDNARISRMEFYTLFCKYMYGAEYVIGQYQSGYPNEKEFMKNFDNKAYAPYYYYLQCHTSCRMPDFITTKQALTKDITKYEVMSMISEYIGLAHFVEDVEEYNKYKDKSILNYCSDIKKNQIMTFKEVCKKYFNGKYEAGEKLLNVCLKNKIIMDYEQAELVYLIDKGILTVDSKNRLNLFNKITYNQAITYLMNYSIN